MKRRFSAVVVGSTQFAVACASEVLDAGGALDAVVAADRDLREWAEASAIPCMSLADLVDLAQGPHDARPDYLFSIVNPHVIDRGLIEWPRRAAVNFHDSLLPRHAGVHASIWAILDGDQRHGVSWHLMTDAVDAGDVVAQASFPMAPDSAALGVLAQVFEAGLATFREILQTIVAGDELTPSPQDLTARTLHRRTDRPPGGLLVDFRDDAASIDRLVRATSTSHVRNDFGRARLVVDGGVVPLVDVAPVVGERAGAAPGTVLATHPHVRVATGSDDLELRAVLLPDGRPRPLSSLAAAWGIRAGHRLAVDVLGEPVLATEVPPIAAFGTQEAGSPSTASAASIAEACGATVAVEPTWIERLAAAEPLSTDVLGSLTSPVAELPVPAETEDALEGAWGPHAVLVAWLAYLARLSGGGGDVGWRPAGTAGDLGLVGSCLRVPAVDTASGKAVMAELVDAITAADDEPGFVADIVVRIPELRTSAARAGLAAGAGNGDGWRPGDGLVAWPVWVGENADRAHVAKRSGGPLRVRLADGVDAAELAAGFLGFVEALLATPEEPVGELPLTSAAQLGRIRELSCGPTEPILPQTLDQLLTRPATTTPDAPAIVTPSQTLTHQQLDEHANQLAHTLQRLDLPPHSPIGVCLPHTPTLPIALLAILKSGHIYLPLDPATPPARLHTLLDRTHTPLLLTTPTVADTLPPHSTVATLDPHPHHHAGNRTTPPRSTHTPRHLAYLIHTSGSTGQPKPVAITHHSAANFAAVMQRLLVDRCGDRLLRLAVLAPPEFDAWLRPVLALGAGHALLMLERNVVRDPAATAQHLSELEADVVSCTPTQLRLLLDQPGFGTDRPLLLLVGGEAFTADLRRAVASRPLLRAVNLYGPTEATIDATLDVIPPGMPPDGHEQDQEPSIGRPIANVEAWVLDHNLQPLPPSIPGQLYLAGHGLAHAYHNHPTHTAQHFLPHPHTTTPGQRLYRTGDKARWNPNGTLQHLGRHDHQTKIRGYRIEPAEIEAALTLHDAVTQAVVLTHDDAGTARRLAAYVVPAADSNGMSADKLRAFLRQHLPPYMVPTNIAYVPELPLTPSGKIDRRKLHERHDHHPGGATATSAPQPSPSPTPATPAQSLLTHHLGQLLPTNHVGPDHNFFELGGDSILALQLLARMADSGYALTLTDVFEQPTIADLAVAAQPVDAAVGSEPAVGPLRLTPIQHWFAELGLQHPSHFNQARLFTTAQRLDPDVLQRAAHVVVHHHDALRIRFQLSPLGATVAETEAADWVRTYHAPPGDEAALATIWAEVNASLDIQHGPLLRIGHVDHGPGNPTHLVVAVHHLAIDAVSWPILLQDLEGPYVQLAATAESPATTWPPERPDLPVAARPDAAAAAGGIDALVPQLRRRTTSIKVWAEALYGLASDPAVTIQAGYWSDVVAHATPYPPAPATPATMATTTVETATLDADDTHLLLTTAPTAHRCRPQDILLTALAHALGTRSLFLTLEGHGRDLLPHLDVSRTLGWFTTMFPVRLDLGDRGDLERGSPLEHGANVAAGRPVLHQERGPSGGGGGGDDVQAVKRQLNAVPDNGAGYGLLRYLGPRGLLPPGPEPTVRFNYLGTTTSRPDGPLGLQQSAVQPGPTMHATTTRPYALDVVVQVAHGRLEIAVHMPQDRATGVSDLTGVAGRYAAAIRTLLRAEPAAGDHRYHPGDFPLADLEEGSLRNLLAELDLGVD